MPHWLKIGVALGVIWGIAAVAIHFAHSAKPTAESITAYMHKNDLAGLSGAARQKDIDDVADMLNRTTIDERQKLRDDGITPDFFHELTPDEQSRFLDATLPTGFKQMMDSFNKMTHDKRKQFVEHALSDMRQRDGQPGPDLNDSNVRKIMDQGLRSFYSDSSADVKMDLAPLIEQMQMNLQR